MDSSAETRINLVPSRASNYYRRSGLDGSLARPAKVVRPRPNTRKISQGDLEVGDTVTLVVYPETQLRESAWLIHGLVIEVGSDLVTIRETAQASREVFGGDYRIPVRYFQDNRVYMKEAK